MSSSLHDVLKGVGLNPQEARVYLTCLKLGTQDVTLISQKVGLSRYDALAVLHHLCELGFMNKFVKRKTFFMPELPEVVLGVLQHSRRLTPEAVKLFEESLPLLSAYRSPLSTRPEVSFYEGKRGIMAAYEDTLTSKTDILAIAALQETEGQMPNYVPRYYQRRKTAGVLIRAIFPDTPMSRLRQSKDFEELRESRLVPAEQYPFTMEMNIYDDKVAYFSPKEDLAVILRSADIAHNMRIMFDLCWAMANASTKPKS